MDQGVVQVSLSKPCTPKSSVPGVCYQLQCGGGSSRNCTISMNVIRSISHNCEDNKCRFMCPKVCDCTIMCVLHGFGTHHTAQCAHHTAQCSALQLHTYTPRCMETNFTTYIHLYWTCKNFLLVNTKFNGARNHNQLQLQILAHAQEMPLGASYHLSSSKRGW